MSKFFITGIGTDIGKTVVSAIVVEALNADYWKPIQAGELDCSDTDKVKGWISNKTSKFFDGTYNLATAMSPHAAAEIDGITIDINAIQEPQTSNSLVIEGAGGLLVPLNDHSTILDLIKNDYKIIVVSRHYLGSINHTLLTLGELKQKGLQVAGIIFNGNSNDTTETIIEKMGHVPVIGRISEEPTINRETVKKYAELFKAKLELIV